MWRRDCRTTLRLSSQPPPTKLSESKVLAKLAWPMSATFCLQQGAQQVNIMFVGHLGAKQLGAVVLATMWANVSGTSICMGGMTALDSLAAQAFGAEKYELVGVLLQRCLAIITLLCIPIFFVWWIGTRLVLEMLGIEPETVELSVLYCRVLFLYLWPQLAQRAIISFLRCQGIVRPVTVITGVASALNVPVTAFLITTFGFIGAPFAQVFSGWLQLIALVIACRWRGYHHRCWGGWSKEALTDWGPMLKLGAAGTITMMGEWWSWEIASGMAATLGEVSLAAHACLSNIVRRQPYSCRPVCRVYRS